MTRVLAAPVEFALSDRDYGKSYNLLNNLGGEGLTVDAYVSEEETRVDAEGVTIHELHSPNKLSYYPAAFRAARRELKTGQFDVYHHVNLSYRWFNPLLLANSHGDTPAVIGPCQAGHAIMAQEFNRMVGHAVGRSVPNWATRPLYRVIQATRGLAIDGVRGELFERTLAAADRIVVVHEEARDVYSKFVDASTLEVIPLGVNPDEFEFTERRDTHSLVAIGSLRERKGYDVLLEALATVSETHPDVHLDVFGKGPQREALEGLAIDLGVESNVTFHGFVDQSVLKEHIADARAFVHPSRSESFSLVRLEAMAGGCPVVVTNTDGAREMVRDGKEGYVVEPERPEALAGRIIELLGDNELARDLGQGARTRVEEKYDWRDIGQQYVSVYEDVVQQQ